MGECRYDAFLNNTVDPCYFEAHVSVAWETVAKTLISEENSFSIVGQSFGCSWRRRSTKNKGRVLELPLQQDRGKGTKQFFKYKY